MSLYLDYNSVANLPNFFSLKPGYPTTKHLIVPLSGINFKHDPENPSFGFYGSVMGGK
jgi:hypothetical protein